MVALYAVSMALSGLLNSYTSGPLPAPRHPVPHVVDLGPEAATSQREMDGLILAGVALGEDRDAAIAVMWTVLNRAKGRPIVEAITEGHAYGTMMHGVFIQSWSLDPYQRWRHPMSHAELRRLEGVAQAVLLGYVKDPTNGATNFHRVGTWTPPWAPSRDEWEQYGRHVFYIAERSS